MAMLAGTIKLRVFLAVGDDGEPCEVGAVSVPLRASEDTPGVITIHTAEAMQTVQNALRGLSEGLDARP